MRALFVQHDHVSPTGPLAERFRHHGFVVEEIQVVSEAQFHAPNVDFVFPSLVDYDVIIPMGAPWGAWDDDTIGRWLLPEIAWIRDAVDRDIPVLGVCFGGQLLSRALGGTVSRAPRAEIGWVVVHTDDEQLVPSGPWFQFHYDRFTVPDGGVEIARNPVCSQAFVAGRSMGVQFHPELVEPTLIGWLDEGGRPQVEADGQDPDAMIAHTRAEEAAAIERTNSLVDAFLTRVAGHRG